MKILDRKWLAANRDMYMETTPPIKVTDLLAVMTSIEYAIIAIRSGKPERAADVLQGLLDGGEDE